jgi:hypothetical protein
MRNWIVCVIAGTSTLASAEPAPPKQCGAFVTMAGGSSQPVKLTGKVKSLAAKSGDASRYDIVVTTPKGDEKFELSISPMKPPFAVGDSIEVNIRVGGGWHRVFDALIKDAKGKVLLITSGSGDDAWADGWKVTIGKIVKREQSPNTKEKSINRTHALDLERGKTKVSVPPNACTVVKDGAQRYLVSGFGNTWDGLRPPEGIDYATFVMIPW